MRRALALAVLALLLSAGCARQPGPAPRAEAPAPRPTALLLAVDHPRLTQQRFIESTTFVLRIGLDGAVTTLPVSPAHGSPIRPDGSGRRLLYSKLTSDPARRELRLYDSDLGTDVLVLAGQVLAYGWDGTATVALTGAIPPNSIPPDFPNGVNIPMPDPKLVSGTPGALSTVAVAPQRALSANLDYVGSEDATRYFAADAGSLVAVSAVTGESSVVATWPILQYRTRSWGGKPEAVGRPQLGGGLVPETFPDTGMPMMFSESTTSGQNVWLEVRRLSDWRRMRRIAVPDSIGRLPVLSADLTRFLRAVSARVDDRRDYRAIEEVDSAGRASRVATAGPSEDTVWPLAYVGEQYGFSYAAITSVGDGFFYLQDDRSGAPRRLATLNRGQLVGYETKTRIDAVPGLVVGIEYERVP